MEADLVRATWGLVAATALLVVAAIIPLLRDIADRRERRRARAANLIPDMNIFRSRLDGGCKRLANVRSLSKEQIAFQHEGSDEELGMIHAIIKQEERPSLLFANELYLVRHLLTQAHHELERAERLADETEADPVRRRDDALTTARRDYKAALISLDAAERLLPKNVRAIKGEGFWDRFARVSDERKAIAEKSFIGIGSIQAERRRR